jgi:hypothetical protein
MRLLVMASRLMRYTRFMMCKLVSYRDGPLPYGRRLFRTSQFKERSATQEFRSQFFVGSIDKRLRHMTDGDKYGVLAHKSGRPTRSLLSPTVSNNSPFIGVLSNLQPFRSSSTHNNS